MLWTPVCTGVTTFYRIVKFDAFVKNSQIRFSVIPVKTGIQSLQRFLCPAYGGMDSRLREDDDFL